MLYERRHTREIAAFGGIAKPMPVYAALFGITAMSSVGLPMLNGFVGEFLILLGAFKAAPAVTAAATFGVVLAAVYLLWMFRRVFFGPVENPENRGLIDLGWRERAVMVAMIVPMFWIGIYPDTLLRRLHPPVLDLLHVMEAKSNALAGPSAERARTQLAASLDEVRP
jgi:NADH-quinone oxidoreductase subunit M